MSEIETASQETETYSIRTSVEFGKEIKRLAAQHFLKTEKEVSRNRILSEYLLHGLQSGKLEKFIAQHLK